MSADQPDPEAGQHTGEGPPAFRVVRRGYDPEEVDAYFSQLAARLNEAVDQYATADRARAELQGEITSLRARAPSFEQVGGEAAALLVEAERAAVVTETDQVRAFRDGLLDDLGRVHGEISGLLERTRRQRDEALGVGAADPEAAAAPNGKAKKPTEPT